MAKARKTNTIVKKSNALIRGQWSIQSVWEPRLIALLASKVHVNDKDFKVYKIPIIEVTGGEHGGKNYKELESIIENLMGRKGGPVLFVMPQIHVPLPRCARV